MKSRREYDIIRKAKLQQNSTNIIQKRGKKMNVVGLWKIKKAVQFDAATMKMVEKDVDAIIADSSIPDDEKKMLYAKFLFTEDGWIKTLFPIPEDIPKEELDEMLESGEMELYGDSFLVIEKKGWKEEDGKLKFDTGTKGEVMGEAVDPWAEIKETEYGIMLMVYGLEKEE